VLGEFKEDSMEVVSSWLVWLTPFGWYQQVHAFHANNWWIVTLFIACFVVCVIAAYYLNSHRDVGMGILPVSKGPMDAPRSLLSPLGLAWRLQRGSWTSWAFAMLVIASLIGAITNEMEDMISEMEQFAELFGGSVIDIVLTGIIGMMGSVVSVFAVQSLLRMRSEEADGLVESVLAAGVNRYRWMMSHMVCTVLGTIAILLLMGLSAGFAAGVTTGDMSRWYGVLIKSSLIQIPAVLVLAGFAVLMYGLAPR